MRRKSDIHKYQKTFGEDLKTQEGDSWKFIMWMSKHFKSGALDSTTVDTTFHRLAANESCTWLNTKPSFLVEPNMLECQYP